MSLNSAFSQSQITNLESVGTNRGTHYVYDAGTSYIASGSSSEAVVVSGLLTTDICVACLNETDGTLTVISAVPTADTLTVNISGNATADRTFSFVVYRAYA